MRRFKLCPLGVFGAVKSRWLASLDLENQLDLERSTPRTLALLTDLCY